MIVKKTNPFKRVSLHIILVVGALMSAFFYAGYALYPFIAGPHIDTSLTQTPDGVRVEGTVKRVSSLWISGLPVPITEQGTFVVVRMYPPGYTEIVVRAEDRFMRSLEKTLTFINTQFTPHYARQENNQESNEIRDSEGYEGG